MIKTVTVTQRIEVEYDEAKLSDEEFNKEFNRYFFETSGIDDHVKHLATCEARGIIGFSNFVEGYGELSEFGIKLREIDCDAEID